MITIYQICKAINFLNNPNYILLKKRTYVIIGVIVESFFLFSHTYMCHWFSFSWDDVYVFPVEKEEA